MCFCVYLTIYSGDKLPPYYIGSSSVDKINNGYRGSVQSKKYGQIWKQELATNPDLFDVVIIEECDTRLLALERELYWQKRCDVVRSSDFVNMSYAQKHGFFGMSTAGRKHTEESLELMRKNSAWKGKSRPHHSAIMTGRKRPEQSKRMIGELNPMFGKEHPNKGKSLTTTYATCPKCGMTSRVSAVKRYHGLFGEKCRKEGT
ncbi:hypothetical protein OPFAMLBM_00164 [Aeromonas phage avDM12-TAAL]|nr:hypothetical protein OPFAMLBM_00164 [Aeromonas phage avDM12-TAAL]